MSVENRIRRLNTQENIAKGPVIYWMSRDQRVSDNWALLYAHNRAVYHKLPLIVVFCLVDNFQGATARHYHFMIQGLKEISFKLAELNIGFILLKGNPVSSIPAFISETGAGMLITDFDPLRIKRTWKNQLSEILKIPFIEIDTHNIVPCFKVSQKAEFGAYTLRPKIKKLLSHYLTDFPSVEPLAYFSEMTNFREWDKLYNELKTDRSVVPVSEKIAGETEAIEKLGYFISERLENYPVNRNNPNLHGTSELSPYLHFGHLSAQRIALEIVKSGASEEAKDAFMEELIVRRELSDNFCYYNPLYDNFDGFPQWARKTLEEHRNDEREFCYPLSMLESAKTHDQLWNAAQKEMVITGSMHGYMRMYWAKKILEWTESPEQALQFAILLNDKYQLDGRDPNGYTGCAWSIGGVHDRAWGERPVFGKIRFMNESGCKRKFDTQKYIANIAKLAIV